MEVTRRTVLCRFAKEELTKQKSEEEAVKARWLLGHRILVAYRQKALEMLG